MKKKIALFLIFLAILTVFHFFWPFGKRSFDQNKAFAVEISENGMVFRATTDRETVSELLAEKKIALGNKDYIFPASDAKIFPGQNIIIRRAIPVAIDVDGQKIKLDTLGTTVGEAITEADVILSHADKISPDTKATLTPDLDIKITRINFEEITVEEDISFQTVEKEDKTVLWRKKETKQKGEKGIREKTYKITYTNGKETSRALLESKIAKAPVNQIEVVGTKIVVGKTQSGDATWYVNGDGLTCASLEFAQGKYLRVTNRANGKSVIVQVNDSGPYGKGRVIDLNKKAFQKIGDIGAGVINVKVEEILN
jgi:uncharacterized protein YabE (DUF348 family)